MLKQWKSLCAVPPAIGFHFAHSDYKNHIRFDEFYCSPHSYILINFPGSVLMKWLKNGSMDLY